MERATRAPPRAAQARQPPAGVAHRPARLGRHRRDGLAQPLVQVVVGERAAGLLEPERLEHEPRGKRLAALPEVAAREAHGHVAAEDGQARDDLVQGLADPVARRRKPRTERAPLVVEQDRVLEERRQHPSLLEPEDEDVGPARVPGARQERHVEVARPRAVSADAERVHAVPHHAQAVPRRTLEGTEGRQLRQRLVEDGSGRAVQLARDGAEGLHERAAAEDERVDRHEVALVRLGHQAQQRGHALGEALDLSRALPVVGRRRLVGLGIFRARPVARERRSRTAA